jgi:hypothetical protein
MNFIAIRLGNKKGDSAAIVQTIKDAAQAAEQNVPNQIGGHGSHRSGRALLTMH